MGRYVVHKSQRTVEMRGADRVTDQFCLVDHDGVRDRRDLSGRGIPVLGQQPRRCFDRQPTQC